MRDVPGRLGDIFVSISLAACSLLVDNGGPHAPLSPASGHYCEETELFSAVKGRNKKASCIALGSLMNPLNPSPVWAGQSTRGPWLRTLFRLSGRGISIRDPSPRRMPWAVLYHPFGLSRPPVTLL